MWELRAHFFIIVSMPTDAWFCIEMEYFIVLSPWRARISGVSHSCLSLFLLHLFPLPPPVSNQHSFTSLPLTLETWQSIRCSYFPCQGILPFIRHGAMFSGCWCHEWSVLPGSQGWCDRTPSARISKSWSLWPKQLGWMAQKNHSSCTTSQTVCSELQLHQTGQE